MTCIILYGKANAEASIHHLPLVSSLKRSPSVLRGKKEFKGSQINLIPVHCVSLISNLIALERMNILLHTRK